MTNPPDRVWLIVDEHGDVPFVADDADAAQAEAALWDKGCPSAAPHIVREYRTHRPTQWRTGVPDAETVERCGNLFALILPDASTLRECSLLLGGEWYWGGAGTGTRAINPSAVEVQWCPEDEMSRETT